MLPSSYYAAEEGKKYKLSSPRKTESKSYLRAGEDDAKGQI